MKVIEEEPRIHVVDGVWTPESVIQEVVDAGQEDPFYVMDIGQVVERYRRWKELMPRVEPFYAVKCNDDKMLIRTLASLGAGFDCASKAEIELVTSLGVSPDRIIFANPAKMASHIRYSSSKGVDLMTFDSETELFKIKQHMPHARVVVRIRCDAESAQCPLGIKFGCDPVHEAPRLLKYAAVLGLDVVGVSFHVGSGCRDPAVFGRALQYCHALFTLAKALGLTMHLVDIGGGFPGGSHTDLQEIAEVINSSLSRLFPAGGDGDGDGGGGGGGVRVIAEPGRYFAAAAYTLATMVHAKREIAVKDEECEPHTMYFINDGVYGSFNCVLYDHQEVHAKPLQESSLGWSACSIWGPSCDALDCVVGSARLPALREGAWLCWRDMGAYTLPVASPFNGFPVPSVHYRVHHHVWNTLKELWPFGAALTPPPSPPPAADPPAPPPLPPIQHSAVFVECALK